MAVDVQVTLSISATSCFIFSQVLNKCILSKKISYLLSRVRLFATPWPVARQAPLPMEFSRQEYWSGLPVPSLRRLNTVTNTYSRKRKEEYKRAVRVPVIYSRDGAGLGCENQEQGQEDWDRKGS